MRFSYETVAIFAFVLAEIVLFGDVATEIIFISRTPHVSDKECNLDEVDESFCVSGKRDPNFNDT
jgi:hypothetical protein